MAVPARRHDQLTAVVRDQIARHGPMTFSALMELALYHPDLGFYAVGGRAGRRGDFLTSPEVGPLFGLCVARYLDRVWARLGEPAEFIVVEHGAGPGTLARAVLAAEPACSTALRYVAVERSDAQRESHPASVESRAEPPAIAAGVVLANELLDNLPAEIFRRSPGGWERWVVDLDDHGALREATIPAGPETMLRLDQLSGSLPVGAVVPDQRAARQWLADRLVELERGSILVVDYGSSTADMGRRPPVEWLRTYAGHERGQRVLDSLGEQDITVEVAIDQLATVAAADRVTTQREWLLDLGIGELVDEGRQVWAERAAIGDLGALTARSRVREAEALIDPNGLGAFLVAEWIKS